MSMGTHDLAPRAFGDLGVQWKFHGVAVRPGKPVAFGVGPAGQFVFGLPGNPVSAFVGTVLFVLPALRGLFGFDFAPPNRLKAGLMVDIAPHRDGRPAFVPAIAWNDAARGLLTRPCDWRGAGDPFGLATANALLVRTRPTEHLRTGNSVEIIPLTNALD
jgi:molybdopterin molybdotransferase